ncbi:hypothetical protein C0995_014840 [Termitomyces sp. Mi166|nr:hypothetical protein C0995_014840 [Termitomyces sp. Mi166\
MSRTKFSTSTVTDDRPLLTPRENTVQNWWWPYKQMLREPAAEFAGTMLLTIFGLGVNCQAVLSSNPAVSSSHKGDWTTVNLGWGAALALGVWVSGGISGGHINPAADYMTDVSAFFSEFLATAILVFVILAATDQGNAPAPVGLLPMVLFITFIGIAASLGMDTGFALNPARDLGPRLLTSMVGYGKAVYTFRQSVFFWLINLEIVI